MSIIACTVDGCETKVRCKNLCNKHYIRMRNHGDPTYRLKPEGKQICIVDDCDKVVQSHGLCGTHHMRMRRRGTLELLVKEKLSCKIPGCDTKHYGRDLCQHHYTKWYDFGDPMRRSPGEIRDGLKICTSCKEDKPVEEFGADTSLKSGISIYCTRCAVGKATAWAAKNPEKAKASRLAHARKHPEKIRDRAQLRQARKRANFVEEVEGLVLADRDLWICGLCLEDIDPEVRWPHPESYSIDHIIPLSRGGDHSYANTQSAHLLCNMRKGARAA